VGVWGWWDVGGGDGYYSGGGVPVGDRVEIQIVSIGTVLLLLLVAR
jgi:hypothetical protein